MTARTVRIVLRTEVPEAVADDVIARFENAARPLLSARSDLVRRTTMLNARTIEWEDNGFGRQVDARKVI